MNRFHDLLAEEIHETELRALAHERAGTSDLADWWRRRGADLRSYLEGARLQQAAPFARTGAGHAPAVASSPANRLTSWAREVTPSLGWAL